MMEVPRRLQSSSFTLALPTPAPSPLSSLGAVEKVAKKNQMREKLQEKRDGTEDQVGEKFSEEETEESLGLVYTNTVRTIVRLSSQDSFSEESIISEERLAEEAEEAKKKAEEEEAVAKERAAQRQLMAMEELVQSERNYLRMLQLSTVTIRRNLQKLQV